MEELNIYKKLAKVRVELQKKVLKKSGENKYAKFKYFELADFIPTTNEMFEEIGLLGIFTIKKDEAGEERAVLKVIDTDSLKEIEFESPIKSASVKGLLPIQELGSIHTYMKRYLYFNALEIVENDLLDSQSGNGEVVEEKNEIPATDKQLERIKKLFNEEKKELAVIMKNLGKVKIEELSLVEASKIIKEKKDGE